MLFQGTNHTIIPQISKIPVIHIVFLVPYIALAQQGNMKHERESITKLVYQINSWGLGIGRWEKISYLNTAPYSLQSGVSKIDKCLSPENSRGKNWSGIDRAHLSKGHFFVLHLICPSCFISRLPSLPHCLSLWTNTAIIYSNSSSGATCSIEIQGFTHAKLS